MSNGCIKLNLPRLNGHISQALILVRKYLLVGMLVPKAFLTGLLLMAQALGHICAIRTNEHIDGFHFIKGNTTFIDDNKVQKLQGLSEWRKGLDRSDFLTLYEILSSLWVSLQMTNALVTFASKLYSCATLYFQAAQCVFSLCPGA